MTIWLQEQLLNRRLAAPCVLLLLLVGLVYLLLHLLLCEVSLMPALLLPAWPTLQVQLWCTTCLQTPQYATVLLRLVLLLLPSGLHIALHAMLSVMLQHLQAVAERVQLLLLLLLLPSLLLLLPLLLALQSLFEQTLPTVLPAPVRRCSPHRKLLLLLLLLVLVCLALSPAHG
jgi:hypothetical protein